MNTRHGETGSTKIMIFTNTSQYATQKELHFIASDKLFQYKTIGDGQFITCEN